MTDTTDTITVAANRSRVYHGAAFRQTIPETAVRTAVDLYGPACDAALVMPVVSADVIKWRRLRSCKRCYPQPKES